MQITNIAKRRVKILLNFERIMNMKLKMYSNIYMKISTEIMLCRTEISKIFENFHLYGFAWLRDPS